MRKLAVAVALVLAASLAHAAPTVSIRRGTAAGSATITIKNAIFRATGAAYDLRVNVPIGVARELAKAAQKGKVIVSTDSGLRGNLVRIVAGSGKTAIVVDRIRQANVNGQAGVDGAIRVQYGLGMSGKAFYYGRTRGEGGVNLGKGTFRGSAGVTRSGIGSLIDPQTLAVDKGAKLDGSTLRWYVKPVGTANRTTDPRAALRSFMPYPDGAHGVHGVTAKPAVLQIAAGL
jgi:hypothetical protein